MTPCRLHGDVAQLVFIGTAVMDEGAIRSTLEGCLLSAQEVTWHHPTVLLFVRLEVAMCHHACLLPWYPTVYLTRVRCVVWQMEGGSSGWTRLDDPLILTLTTGARAEAAAK